MSLVIFCLLFSIVDYVPVKGEIIWYLSLTAWLISLSIVFMVLFFHVVNVHESFCLFVQSLYPITPHTPLAVICSLLMSLSLFSLLVEFVH